MLWSDREGPREEDLHPDGLRGQAHARGAREHERRDVRERVEPHRGDPDHVGRVTEHERHGRPAGERVLVHAHEEDDGQHERRDRPAHARVAERDEDRVAEEHRGWQHEIGPERGDRAGPSRRAPRLAEHARGVERDGHDPRDRREPHRDAVERSKYVRLKHQQPEPQRQERDVAHVTACREDRPSSGCRRCWGSRSRRPGSSPARGRCRGARSRPWGRRPRPGRARARA